MTPINILKAQAAAKRDAIIAQAQLQYRQDLDAIRVLMKQLKPRKPRNGAAAGQDWDSQRRLRGHDDDPGLSAGAAVDH